MASPKCYDLWPEQMSQYIQSVMFSTNTLWLESGAFANTPWTAGKDCTIVFG